MAEGLDIEWRAIYEDGEELPQYNEDGTENLFADIDQNRLKFFVLEHKDGRSWDVNLADGSFRINAERFIWDGFDGADYRLVYFRRNRRQMGTAGISSSVIQHVGWQTTIGEKNHQRVMAIAENGACTIKSK